MNGGSKVENLIITEKAGTHFPNFLIYFNIIELRYRSGAGTFGRLFRVHQNNRTQIL